MPTEAEARVTIGGTRAKRVAAERELRQAHTPGSPLVQSPGKELTTHIYTPATIPDRLSGQPIGRHTPEFIRSKGRTPIFMHNFQVEPASPPSIAAPILEPEPTREPLSLQPSPIQTAPEPLPKRVPMTSLDQVDLALLSTEQTSRSSLLPLQRKPGKIRELSRAPLPTQIQGSANDSFGLLGRANIDSSPPSEPTKPTPLRSATEKGIHARKPSPIRKRIVAATAVVATGLASLSLGLHFLKDKNATPTSLKGNEIIVPLPRVPSPVESLPTPPIINLTEIGTISDQDRTGWGHAANLTKAALDRNYGLNGVTNIVAKVAAYDSRLTSPDPDAARPGDTMITLTTPAIQLVDRLQQPLGPGASQDEKDAAQLIYQLNSLGPMGTQAVIQNYGNEIQALKTHITTILTAQQAQQRIETAAASAVVSTPVEASDKATIVFTLALTAAQTESLRKGKKAASAMRKEYQKRQRQPAFI